jgi:hypothetical protein
LFSALVGKPSSGYRYAMVVYFVVSGAMALFAMYAGISLAGTR